MKNRKVMFMPYAWILDYPDAENILTLFYGPNASPGANASNYSNPEYDQLYKEQQLAIDKNERQKIIWKMQELVFNDRPYIVNWYEDTLQAYRSDRFQGFVESPLGIESQASILHAVPVQ